MSGKASDFCLITLNFVPGWSVTNKILEKLNNFLVYNGIIVFHDVVSNCISFLTDDMGFDTIDLNNIKVDDDESFDKDDPETITQHKTC